MHLIRRRSNRTRTDPTINDIPTNTDDGNSFTPHTLPGTELVVQDDDSELTRTNTLQRNVILQSLNSSEATLVNTSYRTINNRNSNNGSIDHTPIQRSTYRAPIRRHRQDSVLSFAETLVSDSILGHTWPEYNSTRTLPVVSILFQRGVFVFPTQESFDKFKQESKDNDSRQGKSRTASPVLHLCTSYRNVFKRNAPFLIIYKFNPPSITPPLPRNEEIINSRNLDKNEHPIEPSPEIKFLDNKFEYCKIYLKYQPNDILSYKLKFQPTGQPNHPSNFQIMMYYHPVKPYVDTIYKRTRLRWLGFSPLAQQACSSFKVIVLNDESPSLADGIVETLDERYDWNNDETLYPSPNLHNVQRSSEDIFAMLSSLPPLACYKSSVNYLLPMRIMAKKGEIKALECVAEHTLNSNNVENNELKFLKDNTLVLTCMILVLRDHEQKKGQNGFGRGAYDSYIDMGL